MAARLPIVATDIPGNREQVFHERTGLMVPVRDPDALAAAILRLLEDPAMAARLGARAREYAEEHFDVAAMVERNIAIYDELTRRLPAADETARDVTGTPEPAGKPAGSVQ
jgi:glycosyltransferase involved in cell wall biosynthesis